MRFWPPIAISHRFRGDSAFRTWLLSIAWRQALSLRRRRVWRIARVSEPPSASLASGTTPEEDLQGARLRADLQRLVRALPRRLRDPLLLMGSGEYTLLRGCPDARRAGRDDQVARIRCAADVEGAAGSDRL